MRVVAKILLLSVVASPVSGWGRPHFPAAEFYRNVSVAEWLVQYDAAAWRSSDLVATLPASVQQQLGTEWFCLASEDVWECFYGRYDDTTKSFQVAAHCRQNADGKFALVEPSKAPPIASALASA